jgi:hypothetical protein
MVFEDDAMRLWLSQCCWASPQRWPLTAPNFQANERSAGWCCCP